MNSKENVAASWFGVVDRAVRGCDESCGQSCNYWSKSEDQKDKQQCDFSLQFLTSLVFVFHLYCNNMVWEHKTYMEFSSRSIFGGYVETELLRQMNERIVKNFLDILILIELRRGSLSDSELATGLLGKVGEVADPHLVESNLSFLTKEGFITNRSVENQKLYALTDQGKEKVKAVLDSKNKLLGLFLNLFI